MPSSKKHIDEWMKSSLNETTVSPSESFWNKANSEIQSRVSEIAKQQAIKWRKRAFYLGSLALLFAATTVFLWVNTSSKTELLSVHVLPAQQVNKEEVIQPKEIAAAQPLRKLKSNNKQILVPTEQKKSDGVAHALYVEKAEPIKEQNISEIPTEQTTGQMQERDIEMLDSSFSVSSLNGLVVSNYIPAPISDVTSIGALQVPSSFYRRVSIHVYNGFGGNSIDVKDSRTYDSQVPSDVQVKSGRTNYAGVSGDFRIAKHWGVTIGLEQMTTRTGIVNHFFADTTGSGIILDPGEAEGGGEEEEEEGSIGTGNTTVQASSTGYDVITNLGQVHLSHEKNADCTLTNKSYQALTYMNVPIQAYYAIPFKRMEWTIGAGGVYHMLTKSYAHLEIKDALGTSYQTSNIEGLTKASWSARVNSSFNYHLTGRWAIQIGFDYTKGLKPINAATPFSSRLNTFVGRTGLTFNF